MPRCLGSEASARASALISSIEANRTRPAVDALLHQRAQFLDRVAERSRRSFHCRSASRITSLADAYSPASTASSTAAASSGESVMLRLSTWPMAAPPVGKPKVRSNRTACKEHAVAHYGHAATASVNQDARKSPQGTETWGKKVSASWPVSRVLYGPRALRRGNVAAIHLGRMLPCASRNLPGRWAGNSPEGCPSHHPYSVLLPVGFTVPLLLPVARWALTPPFHPYRAREQPSRRFAFCGTFPGVAPAGH